MGLRAESYQGLLTATTNALYLYHSKKESGVMKMKYLGAGENVGGGMEWVMRNAPDAGTQTTATVFGTHGKGYDTSDHVEE